MSELTEDQKRTLGALYSAEYTFGNYDAKTPAGPELICFFCIHHDINVYEDPCQSCGSDHLNKFEPDYVHIYNIKAGLVNVNRETND